MLKTPAIFAMAAIPIIPLSAVFVWLLFEKPEEGEKSAELLSFYIVMRESEID